MNNQLVPEEDELHKKEEILAELENELLQKEVALSILQSNVNAFEYRYINLAGKQFAKLESLKAKLIEVVNLFSNEDKLPSINLNFDEEFLNFTSGNDLDISSLSNPVNEDIKNLFRKVAKKIHPDLSNNEEERVIREELMKRANKALSENNINSLLEILSEWESRPESINGDETGAKLVRVIRKISQIRNRLKNIEKEQLELENSEIYKLYSMAEDASYTGVDFIQSIVDKVNLEIENIISQVYAIIEEQ